MIKKNASEKAVRKIMVYVKIKEIVSIVNEYRVVFINSV